ncbi:MAG: hypothetical protein KBH41_14050 [Azonexus sp.]|nr:hypothetical protein [Azonexus sp.]
MTSAELADFGFNTKCVMASPRLRGWPVKLRHGDDLVERGESGAISVWIAFFSPDQIKCRQIIGEIMQRKFKAAMEDSEMMKAIFFP